MSCNTNSRKILKAGVAVGVATLAGLGAYAMGQSRTKQRSTTSVPLRQLPDLAKVSRVLPLTDKPESGCATCGAKADKAGAWYRVDGQAYCTDCAPKAAKTAGVRLASAPPVQAKTSPSTSGGLTIIGAGGKPVTFKPEAVDLFVEGKDGRQRIVRHDTDAFAVMTGDDPSGLAIVRERTATGGWSLVHVDTGKALQGGLPERYLAEALAVQLTDVNWNYPLDEMLEADVRRAGQTIGRFSSMMK